MSRFFILFTFLFTSLFAEQETFPFIGVTIATHTVNLKSIATKKPNRPKNPASQEETTFGIQYGVQTQELRTTFSAEGNSDFLSVDVEVDYIFMDSMFGTAKVRPYVGGTLGYIRYDQNLIREYNDNRILKNKKKDGNTTTIKNRNGYYGLDFGMLFYVTDDIDLDVSYHYYFMNRLKPLDTMNGATFALHYFY
ncbi:MAG: hypothetical protein DSZ05_02800 [Sulfurospirillum sp.]|nr:MAG: hypothetical protein DSZ05_02800 [Sulfurospirillum sp.]